MRSISRRALLVSGAGLALTTGPTLTWAQTASQPMLVYADGLKNNWSTTGWARVQLETPLQDQKPVELFMAGWSNFGFRTSEPIPSSAFTTLTILVHGGDTGRQEVQLRLKSGDTEHKGAVALRARRNTWQRYDISIQRNLKAEAEDSFDTIEVFNATPDELPPWYMNYVLLQ